MRYQRLRSYVKVETTYPGCVPGRQAPDSFKCQGEFIFEGVREAGGVRFEGSDFRESYDSAKRTYAVSGSGTISTAFNRIVITADRISINGNELPTESPVLVSRIDSR